MFLVNLGDLEKEALAHGITRTELEVPSLVFLTFNRPVVGELTRLCDLEEWEWPAARFAPYSAPDERWRGTFEEGEVAVFIPSMGASSLISFCEELIHYGARNIFFLYASWGLGKAHLSKREIHLPSIAVGVDGTSPHYGNRDCRAVAEPRAFKSLPSALDTVGAVWKRGGVGCCEAFYRITPELADEFRQQGCLSVDNGEVAALYALAKECNIPIGVLLQPYLDLDGGWIISYMGEKYVASGRLQAQAAIEAARIFLRQED